MAKGDIELSKEHGLNPTIPMCFWCGKPRDEIVLLGRKYKENGKEAQAPMYMMMDYNPCKECQTAFNDGIAIIPAQKTPMVEGQPPIGDDVWPTGGVAFLTEQGVKAIFDEGVADEIVERRFAFITPEDYEKLISVLGGDEDSDERTQSALED